jgi:hypothetical protein
VVGLQEAGRKENEMTKVSEEEVNMWISFFKCVHTKADNPLETAADFVKRMWAEIQDQRNG